MDDLLQTILKDIRTNVTGVQAVILFGSYARGEATSDSDIDILVLHDDPGAEDLDVSHQIFNGTTVQVTMQTSESFEWEAKHGHPFALSVLRSGVPLYDDGLFKRMLRYRDRAPDMKFIDRYILLAKDELSRGRLKQAATCAFNAHLLANGDVNLSYKFEPIARRMGISEITREKVKSIIEEVEGIVRRK